MNGTRSIAPASLWSRPKVQEFIQHVRTDPGSVLVVGRGETITVRVPTHENGRNFKLSRNFNTVRVDRLNITAVTSVVRASAIHLYVENVRYENFPVLIYR